jgi:hypothetical protein
VSAGLAGVDDDVFDIGLSKEDVVGDSLHPMAMRATDAINTILFFIVVFL